jgi:hypothetical protein
VQEERKRARQGSTSAYIGQREEKGAAGGVQWPLMARGSPSVLMEIKGGKGVTEGEMKGETTNVSLFLDDKD